MKHFSGIFYASFFSLSLNLSNYSNLFIFSAEDAQDLQVKTLQAEIALMQQDLSSLKAKDEKLEEERRHLECLLSIALKQLHPEKSLPDNLQNNSLSENALEDYLQRFSS